jgi:hypothetical protein
MRCLLVVCMLLLAGPATAASTLYFHATDEANLDNIPMNVLEPPEEARFRGAPILLSCTESPVGFQGHTVYGILYALPTDDLEVPQALAGQARGIAYAVDLVGQMRLQWFVEVEGSAPALNVVVQGTVREGEELAGGVEGYERGRIVASGQSASAILAGPQTQGAVATQVDGRYVYNLTVPMTIQSPRIPLAGMNVRVDVLVENPLCPAGLGPPLIRLHNSHDHRPRLHLEVTEPLRVLSAKVTEGKTGVVHVQAEVLPAWGGYAFAGGLVDGRAGTGTAVVPSDHSRTILPSSAAYYFWDWRDAPAGDHWFNGTLRDVQGNEVRFGPLHIHFEESEVHPAPEGRPSPLAIAPFLGVLAVLVALRRRMAAN